MWTSEHHLVTSADQDELWALLRDVEGWGRWNGGIETISLRGPFAVGTAFEMKPPGEDVVTSTIVAIEAGRLLTDETRMDELVITVEHALEPLGDDGTLVRYSTTVTGGTPELQADVGAAVTADFPDVLARLVQAAR